MRAAHGALALPSKNPLPGHERVAGRDVADVVGGSREPSGQVDDRGPAGSPALGPARADDDAVGPGVEPVRVAEGREVAPDRHEGLLDRILGGVRVAEDAARDEEHAAGRAASELLVGVPVAVLRPFDE